MRLTRLTALLIVASAIAPRGAAAERRASAVSMGVSGTIEGAPFGHTILGLPITIDAGAVVDGELWWHGSASFGAAEAPDAGDGHVFELRTGPRVQHCVGSRLCVGASLELGWGHSRWNVGERADAISYDDVQLEARVRIAMALSPSGLVLVEASAGPRARYYLRAAEGSQAPAERLDAPFARGATAGLALIVRN